MTSRAEIEILLNRTGRTLDGLPKEYDIEFVSGISDEYPGWYLKSNFILHQSNVIELLVAGLRDVLDRPKQKPMTLRAAAQSEWPVWIEIKEWKRPQVGVVDVEDWADRHAKVATIGRTRRSYMPISRYGIGWRCWKDKPTDAEREAASWEE